MVGIREAQEENPKPDTKKNTAVAILDFRGETLIGALLIDKTTRLIFNQFSCCRLPDAGYPFSRQPVTPDRELVTVLSGRRYYHFPVEHNLFAVAGRAYAFVLFKDAVQMAFVGKM